MIVGRSVVSDTSFLAKVAYTAEHAHAKKGMFSRSLHEYNFLTKKDFEKRIPPFNCTRKDEHFCFFYDFRKINFGRFSVLPTDFFSENWPKLIIEPPGTYEFFYNFDREMLGAHFGYKKSKKNPGPRGWKLRSKVKLKKKISDRTQTFCPDVELSPDYEYLLHFCTSPRVLAKIRIFIKLVLYGSWF